MKFDKAIQYAHALHWGQTRRGKKDDKCKLPYITHPIKVLCILQKWGITDARYESMWLAAIFHDLLEDTNVTPRQLMIDWGVEVSALVTELTLNDDIYSKKGDGKYDAKERYINSFTDKSVQSLVIKIADRISNIEDFVLISLDKAIRYRDAANPLSNIFYDRIDELRKMFGEEIVNNITSNVQQMWYVNHLMME